MIERASEVTTMRRAEPFDDPVVGLLSAWPSRPLRQRSLRGAARPKSSGGFLFLGHLSAGTCFRLQCEEPPSEPGGSAPPPIAQVAAGATWPGQMSDHLTRFTKHLATLMRRNWFPALLARLQVRREAAEHNPATCCGGLPKSAFPHVPRRRACRGRGEVRRGPLFLIIAAVRAQGAFGQLSADIVAKVANCPVLIFSLKKIRPATADRCGLNHVTEVAREFIGRR
jgi:hypothetical protein